MDLVHENNGFDPHSAAVLSLGHHVLDLFDTAGNSAEIDELGMCFVSDNAGQGCLPHSRRSPKDHGDVYKRQALFVCHLIYTLNGQGRLRSLAPYCACLLYTSQ